MFLLPGCTRDPILTRDAWKEEVICTVRLPASEITSSGIRFAGYSIAIRASFSDGKESLQRSENDATF